MSGTISLNDAVSACGLDPGAAPHWRSVAPSSARLSFAAPQFSCTRNERDWFLYLAYSAGERPGTVLRRFAENYAGGALVPFVPELRRAEKPAAVDPPCRPGAFFLHARNRNVEASIRARACRRPVAQRDHAPLRGRPRAERASCTSFTFSQITRPTKSAMTGLEGHYACQ
jgi:hypothetical protein